MAVFKCKMCGGTIEFEPGASIGICDSCGTKQTLPRLDDDKRANLYDRANHFRRSNDYDKAMSIYEQILNEDNTDAEAYWSIVLCRYGIEYVEDPTTHKRIPTVNRAQFTSIHMDEDYKSALKYADSYQREIYEKEADAIDRIQKGILDISSKEEPFDVFICYKETDDNGRRTQDSVLANDLYHQLTQEGIKVFFARITLEDKLGAAYEPYIFAALNSAKVMVVIGTRPEYFKAAWVKNEWSRFLALVKASGGKKILIPAYRNMDPYDLPEEFSHLQAQDMSKLGFMQDLVRGIRKIAGTAPAQSSAEKAAPVTSTGSGEKSARIDALVQKAFAFLKDGNWDDALLYRDKILDIDEKNAEAYLISLMAELEVETREELGELNKPFVKQTGNVSEIYNNVLRYGDEKLEAEIRGYNNDSIYHYAIGYMSHKEYGEAIYWLEKIPDWRDAKQKIEEAEQKKEEKEKEERRKKEEEKKEETKKTLCGCLGCLTVILIIAGIIVFFTVIKPKIKTNRAYKSAISQINSGNVIEVYEALIALGNYKDSAEKASEIEDQYITAKLTHANTGDTVFFGKYEQDDKQGDGKEAIEWIVLDKKDNKVLLFSSKVLDEGAFNDTDQETTWQTSTLRSWLNQYFLHNAFTDWEKSCIPAVTVTADRNPDYNTNPGNDTTDQVFLLSISEADRYLTPETKRGIKTKGSYCESWWLRTPGRFSGCASFVNSEGKTSIWGDDVNHTSGVRPAIWVDLDAVAADSIVTGVEFDNGVKTWHITVNPS